jgi:hypothetical protein
VESILLSRVARAEALWPDPRALNAVAPIPRVRWRLKWSDASLWLASASILERSLLNFIPASSGFFGINALSLATWRILRIEHISVAQAPEYAADQSRKATQCLRTPYEVNNITDWHLEMVCDCALASVPSKIVL